jgi:hypothetical protein
MREGGRGRGESGKNKHSSTARNDKSSKVAKIEENSVLEADQSGGGTNQWKSGERGRRGGSGEEWGEIRVESDFGTKYWLSLGSIDQVCGVTNSSRTRPLGTMRKVLLERGSRPQGNKNGEYQAGEGRCAKIPARGQGNRKKSKNRSINEVRMHSTCSKAEIMYTRFIFILLNICYCAREQ